MTPRPVQALAWSAAYEALWTWRSLNWAIAPRPKTQPGALVVSGFLAEPLGISRGARLALEALEAAGHSPLHDDLRPGQSGLFTAPPAPLPGGAGGTWLICANAPETRTALLSRPAAQWRTKRRIGWWAWETSRAPRSWAGVAAHLDEVWAYSRFVAEALSTGFAAAGRADLAGRVRVTAPPVRAAGRPDRARFGLGADAVCALAVADARSGAARKNPLGAAQAWILAFPQPRPDRRLVIKLGGRGAPGGGDPFAELYALSAGRDDISLIETRLSDADMDDLIATADIFLSPHRSEGYGLGMAQAMALGKAVIATGWSGNMDFMDADSAVLLPWRPAKAPATTGVYAGSTWAEPDLAAAAAALVALGQDADRRAALGVRARRRMADASAPWGALDAGLRPL